MGAQFSPPQPARFSRIHCLWHPLHSPAGSCYPSHVPPHRSLLLSSMLASHHFWLKMHSTMLVWPFGHSLSLRSKAALFDRPLASPPCSTAPLCLPQGLALFEGSLKLFSKLTRSFTASGIRKTPILGAHLDQSKGCNV